MEHNMKIYEIGTGYTPIPAQMGAATEIVVEELVRSFGKCGADVTLLDIKATDRPATDLPIEEVAVPGCFTGTDVKLGIMHKLKRVVYSVALAGKLQKILKAATEPVVLHFHNQYNLYFFYKLTSKALRSKAKIAYTVHSYIWPAEWEEIKDTVQKRYFQEIFCVQNADLVFVLNDKTAEHFVNHLGVEESRIFKVGNGVNTDTYAPLNADEIDAFKASIDLDGKQLLLQVGSVCDRKNQLGAAQMLATYLKNNPDTVYAYAGGVIDPEYQAQIEAFAAENGISDQVRYLGELCPGKELNRYYNAADLMLFPSKLESFGLVIIESLSAGTPVALSQQPLFALAEGITICPDSEAFLQAVEKALATPAKALQAREEVRKTYSWDKIARDHLELFSR